MSQKQQGGEGSTNYLAGQNVEVHHHYGVTEERFQELARKLEDQALELWQKNAPRLVSEANQIYDGRAIKMTSEIITHTIAKDRELLERFKDPRAQVVLLKAQQAYGETGDDELAAILAGLVVALVAEPQRTRREIVLREAIECAPRLTSQHLSALSVIVCLTRMAYRLAPDVQTLIEALDEFLSAYYGTIPTDAFEYSYMGATAAGVFLPGLGDTAYNIVFNGHPNAMYPQIHPDEFPKEWAPDEEAGRELGAMLWLVKNGDVPSEKSRIKISPDAADLILSREQNAEAKLTDLQKHLRKFAQERSIKVGDFITAVREQKPELAEFFDTIGATNALHFQPSAVGMMLGRQAVAARSPHAAEQMDKLFAAAE